MGVLCWYLVSSVQVRQPLVYYGGDSVLRLTLFWRASCRSAPASPPIARRGAWPRCPIGCVSGATVALLLQVCADLLGRRRCARPARCGGAARRLLTPCTARRGLTGFGVSLRRPSGLARGADLRDAGAGVPGRWCLAFVPFWTPIFRLVTVAMFWSFHVRPGGRDVDRPVSGGLDGGVAAVSADGCSGPRLGVRDVDVAPTSRHGWERVVSVAAGVLLAYVLAVRLARRGHVTSRGASGRRGSSNVAGARRRASSPSRTCSLRDAAAAHPPTPTGAGQVDVECRVVRRHVRQSERSQTKRSPRCDHAT